MLQELSDIGGVGYYSRALPKGTLPKVKKMNWCGIGIDSTENSSLEHYRLTLRMGLCKATSMKAHMLLENKLYHYELDKWLDTLDGVDTTGWICGLGHGIHKTTPPANVQYFIDTVRNKFE